MVCVQKSGPIALRQETGRRPLSKLAGDPLVEGRNAARKNFLGTLTGLIETKRKNEFLQKLDGILTRLILTNALSLDKLTFCGGNQRLIRKGNLPAISTLAEFRDSFSDVLNPEVFRRSPRLDNSPSPETLRQDSRTLSELIAELPNLRNV